MELTPTQVNAAFKDLGWSKLEAAIKMDVHPDTISNWCDGHSRCKGPAALLLTDFCKKMKEGKTNGRD